MGNQSPTTATASRRPSRLALLASTGMLALCLGAPQAAAQEIPSTAEPGRLDRRLETPVSPVPADRIEVTPAPGQTPVPGSADLRVTLQGIDLQGVTVYGLGAFDDLVAPLTGREIALSELFTLAERITARYRADGWVLTRAVVPAQRITDGRATLQIVEGFIAETALTGDAGPHAGRLKDYLAQVSALPAPVNIRDLERWLLLANDLPGLRAKAVLSPAEGRTGGSTLTLDSSFRTIDAFAQVDNRGSDYQGPWRVVTGFALNGLVPGGRLAATGIMTPEDTAEQRGLVLSWDQQVGGSGGVLGLTASFQDGEPGEALAPLEIVTESRSYALRYSHPILRSRGSTLIGEVEAAAYEATTEIFGQPFAEDKVRTVSAGLDYTLIDGLGGANRIALRGSAGLDVFDGTGDDDLNKSRAAASTDFVKATLRAERVQRIAGGLSARLAVAGQTADGPLLASEEFKLGGGAFGRAFDEGELSGDHGLGGSAELRFTPAAALLPGGGVQLYVFYDYGRTWNDDPAGGVDTLASWGGGIRGNLSDWLSLDLQAAKPLMKDVATQGDREPRLFLSVTARY